MLLFGPGLTLNNIRYSESLFIICFITAQNTFTPLLIPSLKICFQCGLIDNVDFDNEST